MEKGTAPPKPQKQEKRPVRGKVSPRVKVEEKVIGIEVVKTSKAGADRKAAHLECFRVARREPRPYRD